MNNDDYPAFPGMDSDSTGNMALRYAGMGVRAYFAAKAMQGTLANPNGYETPEHVAEYAVKCADALIAALEK